MGVDFSYGIVDAELLLLAERVHAVLPAEDPPVSRADAVVRELTSGKYSSAKDLFLAISDDALTIGRFTQAYLASAGSPLEWLISGCPREITVPLYEEEWIGVTSVRIIPRNDARRVEQALLSNGLPIVVEDSFRTNARLAQAAEDVQHWLDATNFPAIQADLDELGELFRRALSIGGSVAIECG
jgi:hypothetical protein